ncbi:hypothetical protein C1752_06616 [Acaryochloris thomasi RCC1774]|uniref:Uncharacterized protein n=1 Tax=Acaryochloris thomasi RCC1774 TaxID=1764569 RepID=A0A2W1JR27_9CYAN|nr:hypothetical protein C1752_06616 [Acaryochloris thomasi RCC1774]
MAMSTTNENKILSNRLLIEHRLSHKDGAIVRFAIVNSLLLKIAGP